jgi:hypothetical protein
MRDCPCGTVVFNRCFINLCVTASLKLRCVYIKCGSGFYFIRKLSWVRILHTAVPRFATYSTVNFCDSTGSELASFALNQLNFTNEVSFQIRRSASLYHTICAACKTSSGWQAGYDTHRLSRMRDHMTIKRVVCNTQQKYGMLDLGITHQISRIHGSVFLENQGSV